MAVTPLLLAVADVADQTVTQWVVGLIATGVVGVLIFLLKHAVTGLTTSVEANTKALEVTKTELLVKLDALRDQVQRGDGDRRVLEVRLVAVEHTITEMKRELRELSEGIAR